MSASHQKVRYFSYDIFGVLDDNNSLQCEVFMPSDIADFLHLLLEIYNV